MIANTKILDHHGNPYTVRGRQDLAEMKPAQRRAKLSYDALRDSTEYRNIWVNADSFDADSANDLTARHRAMRYSRYEAGSNGYYAGALKSHVEMMIGCGPTLRMLTDNAQFNRKVEREWYKWGQRVQLRRKLLCMAHARFMDGEVFGIMLTNPSISTAEVSLDLILVEGEQVTTPYLPFNQPGYIDGIRFDPETNEILWYDILPQHPGSNNAFLNQMPNRVPAGDVLHWFKMRRPGQHRGMPDCLSTLNVGAAARRWREATLGAAETAAEPSLVLETQYTPDELDVVTPMSTLDFQKRMITALPNNMRAHQIEAQHPNAQYTDFHQQLINEQTRPLGMPLNAALGDSSKYSFASGKLDNLLYYAGADRDREDCNDLVMDPLFAQWYREWLLTNDSRRGDEISDHQWDWPAHPVIDEVSHASAVQTNLATGKTTLSRSYSEDGEDFQDGLTLMAEEWFGEASEANIAKARTICVLRNTPAHAINQVAAVLGVEMPKPEQPASAPADAQDEQVAAYE